VPVVAHLALRLQSDNRAGLGMLPDLAVQTVTLTMRIEASAVDTFVKQLREFETHRGRHSPSKSN
jgi:hypothetical protein